MCHVSCVTFFLFIHFKLTGEASWWRVWYQGGRPRLVLEQPLALPGSANKTAIQAILSLLLLDTKSFK